MPKTKNVASFVVRFTQELWRDKKNEPFVRWRGHIRHVQGNEEDHFTDFAEAITFIQNYLTQLTMKNLEGEENMTQAKVFRESFKLWEHFASSYTNMMFQATEQFLKQSEAFREQVDEARGKVLEAWQFPFQPSQDQELLTTVKELQAAVELLSKRVAVLEKKLHQQE